MKNRGTGIEMTDAEFSKTKVLKYIAWTFVIAYAVQVGAAYVWNGGNRGVGQLIVAVMMYVPALSVLLAGAKLKDMGWKPQIRKNIRYILIAWFCPLVFTAIGAALYFLIFPGHFDLSGAYITKIGGDRALQQLEENGLSYRMYVMVSIASALTYGPLVNTFAALGEEIGWRGFLYPQLKAGLGRKKGLILGGVIWGAWHWPLIILVGYEYGAAAGNTAGYAGAPVSGMLLFCVISAGLGIIHDWVYEKSGTIWLPALLHGSFNAAAAIPLMVCITDTGTARLLGPASVGIISGLPMLALAAVLLMRRQENKKNGEIKN